MLIRTYTKNAYRALFTALERQRASDGRIKLTYEVVYGHAFRLVSRTTDARESIVRFDVPKKHD